MEGTAFPQWGGLVLDQVASTVELFGVGEKSQRQNWFGDLGGIQDWGRSAGEKQEWENKSPLKPPH